MLSHVRIGSSWIAPLAVGLMLASGASAAQQSSDHSSQQKGWTRHCIDDSSRGADGVRLADANGDGRLDISTGWEEGGCVRVYLHPGPEKVRQQWPAVTVGQVGSPEDAVLVDLDGDGAMDVVSSCQGQTRQLWIHWAPSDPADYLNSGKWTTQPLSRAGRAAWMFCLPLQIDGKFGMDLVVGSKGKDAQIGWLQAPENPRDANAWRYHRLQPAGWIMSLQAHDLSGDGLLDILATDRKGKHRGCLWLEHPGLENVTQASAWKVHRASPYQAAEPMFLWRKELPGCSLLTYADAQAGLVLLEHPFPRPKIDDHPEKRTHWFQKSLPLPEGAGRGKAVAVGDLNGDQQPEVVISCGKAEGKKFGIFACPLPMTREALQRWSELTPITHISGPQGSKFDRLELVDLDDDGDLDVLTCEERENLGVIWYENPAISR